MWTSRATSAVTAPPSTGGEVAADGQRFAFVKAPEGEGWLNPHYLEDVHAAHQAGLIVGTYHYARPAKDARTQAAHYAAALATAPAT